MTKRLPQVGEIWFNGHGETDGPLKFHDSGSVYVLHGRFGYTTKGQSYVSRLSAENDLVLIHKDATGKVIHATFDPDLIGEDDTTESDPITKAITEAEDRAKGLRDLQIKLARAATMQGDLATLKLEIALLRDKYLIEAKPTTWYPIKKPKAKKAGKRMK